MTHLPVIIGIAGGSCSGKTTFSTALEAELCELSPRVFHLDQYFLPLEERPHTTGFANGKDYRDDNSPASFGLERLHHDLETAIQSDVAVIIVEGILALWDEEIYSKLDLRLYVDCPDEERVCRRIRRHLSWGQEFEEITDRYLNAVRPRFAQYVEPCKWRADLILNGSFPSDTALKMISSQILTWVKQKGISYAKLSESSGQQRN